MEVNDPDNFYIVYLLCDNSQIGVHWPTSTSLQFNWNTTNRFTNGTHTLKARSLHRGLGTYIESEPIQVEIYNENPDVPFVIIDNLVEDQTVSGRFVILASQSHPEKMTRLSTSFWIDGKYIGGSHDSPAHRTWVTKEFSNGPHTVKVVAHYCHPGLIYKIKCMDTVSVNVDNPGGQVIPHLSIDNLTEGQEVQGTVTIIATSELGGVTCHAKSEGGRYEYVDYDYGSPHDLTWHTQDWENGPCTVRVFGYGSNLMYEKRVTVIEERWVL